MPSFSVLKRLGRELSSSRQSRSQQQQPVQRDLQEHQDGSAKPSASPSGATGGGAAVAGDSDHDSGGIGGVGGSGRARRERRNSTRDLLLRMMRKPPSTPLRGTTQSQPPTPQRSTTFAVSQRVPLCRSFGCPNPAPFPIAAPTGNRTSVGGDRECHWPVPAAVSRLSLRQDLGHEAILGTGPSREDPSPRGQHLGSLRSYVTALLSGFKS